MLVFLEPLVFAGGARGILLAEEVVRRAGTGDVSASGDPLEYGLTRDALQAGSLRGVPCWLREERLLIEARERYPDVPVYGLWQVLEYNRLLPDDGVLILRTTEQSGVYLYLQGGRPLAAAAFAAGIIPVEEEVERYELDVEPGQLSLPPLALALRTRAEHDYEARQRRKRAIKRRLLIAVGVLLLGGVVDGLMSWRHQAKLEGIKNAEAEWRRLRDRLDELGRSRLMRPIDQTAFLQTLSWLGLLDSQLMLDGQAFMGGVLPVDLPSGVELPPGYSGTLLPDGRLRVMVEVPGVAPRFAEDEG